MHLPVTAVNCPDSLPSVTPAITAVAPAHTILKLYAWSTFETKGVRESPLPTPVFFFFSGPTAGLQSSLLLQVYVSALIFGLTMVGIADRKTVGIFGSL